MKPEEIEYEPFLEDQDRKPILYGEAGNELPDDPAMIEAIHKLYPEIKAARTFGKRAE